MSLCINPNCSHPENVRQPMFCESCGSEILLQGIYRVTRQLGQGGFGITYEVSECSVPKVLKVLRETHPKAVNLFKQEADVLSQMDHPGIPKVEPGAYFTFLPRDSRERLHCFVMEKIKGMNLEEWMEGRGHQPISEKVAICWLQQLTEILHQVHQKNYFHRDIKPSNIMLKPDGQLALIDFGTARELSHTYFQKVAKGGGTTIGTKISSAGYTPYEQVSGRAVPQSDFFALGRTFVYLLTAKEPHEFQEDPRSGKLMWSDRLSDISPTLVRLIDYLIEPFWHRRVKDTQELMSCITALMPPQNMVNTRKTGHILTEITGKTLTEIKSQQVNSNLIKYNASKKQINGLSWRRFFAFIIDHTVYALIVSMSIYLIGKFYYNGFVGYTISIFQTTMSYIVIYLILDLLSGKPFKLIDGKQIYKIRIVTNRQSKHIKFSHLVLRSVIKLLSIILVIPAFISLISLIRKGETYAIHEQISKTIVVKIDET